MTPVTAGIDCVILDLVNGKTLLWFDMEGVNNRDRPELSMLLAILTQITNHLIFIDKSLNDTLRSSLGRIVGSRMIMIQGQNVTWPRLNIALSASRLRVNDETLTAAFAPGDNFTEQESQVLSSDPRHSPTVSVTSRISTMPFPLTVAPLQNFPMPVVCSITCCSRKSRTLRMGRLLINGSSRHWECGI
jgi:hypothetical protein